MPTVPGLAARNRSTAAMRLRMVQLNPRPMDGQDARADTGLAAGLGDGPVGDGAVGVPAGRVAAAWCCAACDGEHAASAATASSAAVHAQAPPALLRLPLWVRRVRLEARGGPIIGRQNTKVAAPAGRTPPTPPRRRRGLRNCL